MAQALSTLTGVRPGLTAARTISPKPYLPASTANSLTQWLHCSQCVSQSYIHGSAWRRPLSLLSCETNQHSNTLRQSSAPYLLFLQRARFEASPQGAVQEAGGPTLLRGPSYGPLDPGHPLPIPHPCPSGPRGSRPGPCPRLGGVHDAVAETRDWIDVAQAPSRPACAVALEILKPQSRQVLQILLRGREMAADQRLMGLTERQGD